jgi:trimeric autotransporter adhesin
MSTKTSIKRIAAVAAVALTLGGFSAVSASATVGGVTALSAGTSYPARVGVLSGTTTIAVTVPATNTGLALSAQIVSAPTTSKAAVLQFAAGATLPGTGTTNYTDSATVTGTYLTTLDTTGVAYATFDADATTGGTTTNVKLSLNADVAGTYQILVTSGGSATTGYSTGLVSTVYSITTAGTPTSLSTASVGSVVDSATNGAKVTLTMKDANGAATILGPNESINITHTGTTTALSSAAGSATAITSFGTTADSSGKYVVYVRDGGTIADGTDVITFTGTGVLSSSVTTNKTVSTAAATAAVGVLTLTSAVGYAGTGPYTTSAASAHTFTFTPTTTPTVDTVYPVDVVVTNGDSYATSVTVLASVTTGGKVTVAQALSTAYPTIVVTSGSAITINKATATATTIAIQGAASVVSATGAKNTFTALVSDQFGVKMPYQAVTIAVTGRNTVATTSIGVTDANGLVSYSLTDAGTTGTSDAIVFTDPAAHAVTAKITYGTFTVSTVTVTGGSTVADAANGATNKTAISTADNGPEASAVAIKAVVKDASGNLLAGVPVTFTVDKGLTKKTAAVDYATVYTGSDGSATTYAFNWVVGKQTITATAGGVSKSDYITWAATDSTSARVLSSSVSGSVITYTVKDRFGNGVKGVTVNLTRTGSGLFGNGSSTQDVITGTDGTVDATFAGTGAAVGTLASTYAQAYAPAGQYDFTAGDTYTAAVAGTTSGTGASLAPAGVYTVSNTTGAVTSTESAANAATDAANEATDAANAATDAALAAADAADAATAAAQDASDAVASLASKVEAMVASLKAQITSLTNLVIKIQKKVKA